MAKPQIFNRDMKRLAYLDNALAVGYGLETNSLWTATFTLPADDPKNAYCTPLNFVEIFDGDERIDLFRIIGEDMERSNGATRYYDCEHVLATLLSDVLFQYHQCGGSGVKTADVLNYILARQTRQNWKLGACDFKRYFEYNWENSTLLAALFAVPECFDSEYLWSWDTTVYPWTLSLTVPTEALKSEIRYAKNMTNIKKTTDATSIANRVYALGYGEGVNQLTIESVNGGVPYVEDALSIERYGLCSTILVDSRYQVAENLKAYAEQILAGLKEPYVSYEIGAIDLHRLTGDKFSKFRPGEIVRVVDEADGINLRTRIVRVEKADAEGDPGNVTVTIANKTQDIAGSISDLQSRALISETYAQGATNQQIYNFSDNADATHPAKLQLYISDSVVRINKMLLISSSRRSGRMRKLSAAAVDKRPPPAAGRQRAPAAALRPPPAAGRPPAERRSSPRTCSRVRRTDRPCITTAFLNTPTLQRPATGKPLTDTRRSFGRARIRIRRTRTGFPHIHTRSTTIRTR